MAYIAAKLCRFFHFYNPSLRSGRNKKRKINLVIFLGLQNKKERKVSKLRQASKPFTLPELCGNIKVLQKRQ